MPETIYYWDGVVLISDQRIMLGHWLYDPAAVRTAEVTRIEYKKLNTRAFLAVSTMLILALLVFSSFRS